MTTTDDPNGWLEVIRGGDRVFIRPIRANDAEMERRFIEELSPASRRFRFLETMRSPGDQLLHRLTTIDPATEVAFVAVLDDEAHDHEIGVGRFSVAADGRDCEFAIVVSDEWQRKGLASHLMHHLIDAARARGIGRMHSSDSADNHAMRAFAARLPFDHCPDPEDASQVLYSLDLTPPPIRHIGRP
ncbi:putative enzyme [Burkholderiales bacterium 8X]|nr:putative enzyme [Burkholderiales bacterium 8X]